MKCDLCSSGEALENGLLCMSCRETIIRLQVLAERTRGRMCAENSNKADGDPERAQTKRVAKS
jgi:hypothetical protein